jgi:hypothetical protein
MTRLGIATLLILLLPALTGACGDESSRGRALAETVAGDFRKDCEKAPAPSEAARRHRARFCACGEAKIAATPMRFGEPDESIGDKIQTATDACTAEIGGLPGEKP